MKATVSGSDVKTGGIALHNLQKRYGNAIAVDDVSLSISPGEFISLLGPSGSGKTTSLMMIAGFETPDSGQILLDGKDITRLPPHRRELGVIFQNYALFPHMTVAENVAYPLRMRRMAKVEVEKRVGHILDQVHLGALASRYPHQMSGGQQQRVAIARALVFDPPVLLLDEPLGALDKKLREHLRNEIKTLHKEVGKTMIYVTHDQDEALSMSDRVAVMHEGRIRQVSAPKDIYRRPADLFVAGFVGEVNLVPVKLKSGTVHGPASENLPAPEWQEADRDATLCVRPEHLHLKTSPPGSSGGLQGRISGMTFVGDATIFQFRSETGLELLSKVLNVLPETMPGVGDPCVASWAANDATILTE
ncbi:polyamine ABC transporter ATP-binding protein [Bradyrhizobium canariense]|uniref:Spermidine/putrescine import ATP-binding protein PotA n=2 Tax=Bradyrhizobium canariense TaxID=255045 RepID=A0A1X3HC05_9BRAD|nr:ABC transporter ATP-binding protein [Bradyrhizobium canariense]OSI73202.1 polyamine ABC transporter ATP-binding protein [Bradyrhizobium canariense]OSI81304.1 polyamine ABC transporter ATP-binding protein [Bradyrhizobium canariense]OSI94579.1 polyamine ABC transporter ATP-binding protein [Bradyrhizobium canariense]OSI95167.1 polyamine ABC transporter ATP-binding protein [Bradyrhizobium canariense]OSJ08212.1 polyamine ABC transporter ATP-binding protein [Bradyrhizobium canariense]